MKTITLKQKFIAMKKNIHFTRSLAIAVLSIFLLIPGLGWGQLYWNINGTSAIWTSANWGASGAGPFTTAWVPNTDAIFSANSAVTFATTSIGNVTVADGVNVTVTQDGTMSMDGAVRTFAIGTGATLTWTSQGVTANSTAGITKNGSGTLNLGALTYTTAMSGGFTLNNGTIVVSGAKALGSAGVTINGGTLQSSNSSTFGITGLTIGGDFTLAGTGDDIWTVPVSLGSSTRTITNSTSSGSRLFSGIISGSAGSGLTFAGSGTAPIQLSNANTYTGLTTVSGGNVQFNRTGGTTIPGTNDVNVNGGTLNIKTDQTLNNLTLSSGTLTIDAGVTLTINGTFVISGGTITGTIAYGSASTLEYAGSSTQTATALEWPQSSGPANVKVNNSAGFRLPFSRTLTGDFNVAVGDVQNQSGTAVTLTLSGSASNLTIAGSITGTDVGSGNDINVVVSGINTTVSGTGSLCRFLNATVNSGSTLVLQRSFEVMFGAFTMNGTLQMESGGYISQNAYCVAATYGTNTYLIYNTNSYTTTNYEFPASGVVNVTMTAPSGTNTLTLNGDKVIAGTLVVGAHTLNGGKSINAATITIDAGSMVMGDITTSSALTCTGASSISLTGAWSVTGFTKSTSTVTFTGTGNINNPTNFYNLTNSAETRSVTQNIDVENTLTVSGGQIGVTGGSGRSLTMSGASSIININGGAIYGTDAGTGNDLSLIVSGDQITLTGNATISLDDEKKFFNVTINAGKKLILQRGILCKYGTFTCIGTIQIDANGYIQNDASYNSNAKAPVYNATSGSLIYNNGGAYTSATEWPATNSPYNVSLQNAGTNVTISGNRIIEGTLTLTNGLITTGTNTITIGSAGNVSGANASSYVDGKLARVYAAAGSKSFAIGKGGNYRPLTVNYTTLTSTSTVTAEQTEGTLPGSLPVNTTLFNTRYWTLTESGSPEYTYNITLDGTGFSPTYTPVMIKGDGSTNAAFAVTTPDYTNATTGFTGFSNFGLGEIANTSTTTTPDDKTVCYGSTLVSLTASVNPNPGGGTVSFKIGGSSVGIAPISVGTGIATLNYNPSSLAVGNQSIHADFSGFGDFIASSSSPDKTLTVTAVPVTPTTAVVDVNNFCTNATGTINLSVTGGSGTSVGWYTGSCGGTLVGSGNPLEINKPTNTTTYYARWETSTCGASECASVIVTVNALPVADAGASSAFGAVGTAYTFPGVTATGGTILWTWSGSATGTLTEETTATPSFTPASTGTATFTLTVTGCTEVSDNITLYILGSDPVTWSGGANTHEWNTPGNWVPALVPIATTNVNIPAGLPYYPTIISAPAVCLNITVQDGASLIDNGNLTIGGTLTVNHSSIAASNWHYISSPVSGLTSNAFLGHFLYDFVTSTDLYTPITSTSVPLTAMKGFALYPKTTAYTAPYVGGLNPASNSFTISAALNGWNLIGNPYPSAIDWDAASGWTKTGVVNDAIYIYNGTAWSTYIAGAGTGIGTRYIAPTQGFFVKASSGGTMTMTSAVQVHNTVPFYKSADGAVTNLLRMEVSGNGYQDDAVVRFLPEATAEFDGNFDAYKRYGDIAEAAQLYTLGSIPLAINSLPEIDNVPVGIKIGAEGSYTIAATEMNDIPFATLEDTETGIFTDLSYSPYTFTSVAGTFDQRFILHFSMLSVAENKSKDAAVYSYQQTVYINLKNQVKGDIFIYNITGQLVASRRSAQGTNEIKLPNTGNYIVKVISKNNTVVRKVFIH
jgi:autotransporter-associated beta strand protein